jgi:hypothetical protein
VSPLRQVPAAVVTVLALGVPAACSEDGAADRPGGAPLESPSAFDAATATLVAEPFCEEVDATLVAGALDVPADTVALVSERVVDEERPGADDRSGPSDVNSCTFGSESKRLVVAVRPRTTEAEAQRRVDAYREQQRGRSCQLADDPWFGTPGVVADCDGPGGRRTVAVVGLVGGSGFFCSSVVGTGAGPDLLDATVEVCRDTVETLGVPG